VSDGHLGTTRATTSQTPSSWIFGPATSAQHTTTESYQQRAYIDLDDMDDDGFDVVVRQSDQGPRTDGDRLTTSTGVVPNELQRCRQ